MKTAVIYARYSSDNQTEQSIEGQLRVCQEYAQRNDIFILDTYIDRAMTGTNDNRPDFQKMIKDSADKNWQYIIVYKLDRFSRNKYEIAKYKKILKDNGVKLLSAMENIPDTPEGIILESLLEGMAEYYSAELSQKVRRGMNESRLKGNYTGGPLPYGYKVQDKKIVIDEQRAEIVRYIFKEYSLDKSVGQIIKDLANNGVLYKGKPFYSTTLYALLRNTKYLGIYKIGDKNFNNMFPRIIDDETFDKVRNKMKTNRYGKKSVITNYLFRHKLVCGYCGMPISAESCRTRYGKKMNYYKCVGIKKYRNGCQKQTIRKEILEDFLLEIIVTELSKPKIMNNLVYALLEIQTNSVHNNQNLRDLINKKIQTETALNNIVQAIEAGVFNKTTNSRMQELEKQITVLAQNIEIEKAKAKVLLTEKEIRMYYKQALLENPNILINYLVKHIKLYNDKIEFTFNTPLKASPNNQDLPFFITQKYLNQNNSTLIECVFCV